MLNAVIGNLLAALLLNLGKDITFVFIILSVIACVGTVSFIFLRKVSYATSTKLPSDRKVFSLVLETFQLFSVKTVLLLVPPLIYSGFSQSFFYSLLPQMMARDELGFVLACFGAMDAFGSIFLGKLSDLIGKKTVILLATSFGLVGYSLSWIVTTDSTYMFYIVMILFGISDAGYNTQLYAIMGVLQPDNVEVAYAFLKLIQSSTTGIAFVYSLFLNLHEIIILVGFSLVVGAISFVSCDTMISRNNNTVKELRL